MQSSASKKVKEKENDLSVNEHPRAVISPASKFQHFLKETIESNELQVTATFQESSPSMFLWPRHCPGDEELKG